jgi:hypothetical protein
VLSLNDAIAGLDSGEIQPGGPTITLPFSAAALPDELVDQICPPPPTGLPSRRRGCWRKPR